MQFLKKTFAKDRPASLVAYDELKLKTAERINRRNDLHARMAAMVDEAEGAAKKFYLSLSDDDLNVALAMRNENKNTLEFLRESSQRIASFDEEFFQGLQARKIIHAALCDCITTAAKKLDCMAEEDRKRHEEYGLEGESTALAAARKELDRLREAKDQCENEGNSDDRCYRQFSRLIQF